MSMNNPVDTVFTESVKAVQARKGSRDLYEKMSPVPGFFPEIDDLLENFIAKQNSVFFATVNADGLPYIQHRGGPAGFIKVLDKNTLAFAEYKGNRQHISEGNLLDNNKAFLFLIDYTTKQRIKIWGSAEIVSDDEALLNSLMPPAGTYRARAEQVVKFTVSTWDRNCPQHIPLRLEEESVSNALVEKDQEIERLKAEIEALKRDSDR